MVDPLESISLNSTVLMAQMRPALVKYFRRRCGSAAEAEDLAHDVLSRALSHCGWTSIEQAKGYIFRAAVNRWRDRNRRVLSHGDSIDWDDTAYYAEDEEPTPERVLEIEEQLHDVIRTLSKLNERTRDVFILIRVEKMKQKDIAEMFGISVSAVEKHLAKALDHLARSLGASD
jgi:RNA polymerase sigma factor (sigma-70 family)